MKPLQRSLTKYSFQYTVTRNNKSILAMNALHACWLAPLITAMLVTSIFGCSRPQDQATVEQNGELVVPEKVYTRADYDAYRDDPRHASVCLNASRELVEDGVGLSDIPEGIMRQHKLITDWTPRDHQFAYRAGSEKVYLSSWISKLDPQQIKTSKHVTKHLEQIIKMNAILEHLDLAYQGGDKISVIDRQFLLFGESWDRVLSKTKSFAQKLTERMDSLITSGSELENLAETNSAAKKLSGLVTGILDEAESTAEKYEAMLDSQEWPAMNFAVVVELIQANDSINPMKEWSNDQKIELYKQLVSTGDPPAAGIAASAAVELLKSVSSDQELKSKLKTVAESLCQEAKKKGDATAHFATAKLHILENDPGSIDELRKASEMGLPLAASTLGRLYSMGKQVDQSYESARGYFQHAFDLGDTSIGKNLGLTLYIMGRRDELVKHCKHDSMQNHPRRIYEIAEVAFPQAPRFARELIVLAHDAALSNDDSKLAAEAEGFLERTKPSALLARQREQLAADQAESNAHAERLRMLQIEQEVDEQMEYNIWRAKQR